MASKRRPETSSAYRRFEHTIERSLNLIELYEAMARLRDTKPKSPLNRIEIEDLIRASVVLSVAAVDSYFTDVFAERLVPFLKKLMSRNQKVPQKMVDILYGAGLDTRKALA